VNEKKTGGLGEAIAYKFAKLGANRKTLLIEHKIIATKQVRERHCSLEEACRGRRFRKLDDLDDI
jgi:hypothetical protein